MDESDNLMVAGTAAEVMNPPEGLKLAGYPTERPNTGVGLDLCARAAVFGEAGAGRPAAALVVLDTIGVPADLVGRMRDEAARAVKGLRADAVMIAATHTHSAVSLRSVRKGNVEMEADPGYVELSIAAVGKAAAAAWNRRQTVRARVGLTEAWWGHNRRVVDMEGRATNEWLYKEETHHGYFNPRVRYIVLEDPESGAVRSILSAYGCHPVTLGPPNRKVSADYPGYFVRALEKATGMKTAIHITGAAANINPRDALHESPDQAKAMGEGLASEVIGAIGTARPFRPAPIVSRIVPLRLGLGPNARDGLRERSTDGTHLVSEIQAIRLGDLVFVSAPGELFAEIGTSIENQSPFRHTMVVGYANDNLGYLCTETACREGGYEPSRPVSPSMERPILAAAREALKKVQVALS